jgi:hypothetical protein
MKEPSLPMRIEHRERLRSDAGRDWPDGEREVGSFHQNVQSPLTKPPISPGCPCFATHLDATVASASRNAAASESHERHALYHDVVDEQRLHSLLAMVCNAARDFLRRQMNKARLL